MSLDPHPAVLLDTCAVIWLAHGDPLNAGAEDRIVHAAWHVGVWVSPVSAWEVGVLSRPKPGRALDCLPDPATGFARVMAGPGVRSAALTADIAIAASHLPEPPLGDPADRLLIATAHRLGVPIVTRDSWIIDYAAAGHVQALVC